MSPKPTLFSACILAALLTAASAHAAVTMSLNTSTPTAGDGISQLDQSGTAGTGDYLDNSAGQSFTTGSNTGGYTLNSFSFKINTAASNYGSLFNGSSVWGVQVARFDNVASGGYAERTDNKPSTTYSAQYTNNLFTQQISSVTAANGNPSGSEAWITISFSAGDLLTLNPNSSFVFSLWSPNVGGFIAIHRSGADVYAGGYKYDSFNPARGFTNNYAKTAYDHDRTFVADLTAVSAIPEPSTYAALLGLVTLGCAAFRRRSRV
jgi:hypothetical protein